MVMEGWTEEQEEDHTLVCHAISHLILHTAETSTRVSLLLASDVALLLSGSHVLLNALLESAFVLLNALVYSAFDVVHDE